MVLDAVIVAIPANKELLVRKSSIVHVCVQIRNHIFTKPRTQPRLAKLHTNMRKTSMVDKTAFCERVLCIVLDYKF